MNIRYPGRALCLRGSALLMLVSLTACEDPLRPPEPVVLDATYEAVMSAFGPLPVRFDHLLDPPDSGEWWHMEMAEVTIEFEPDGTYRMDQLVRDSMPRGDIHFTEWTVAGSYEVVQDTVIHFEIDSEESFSKIGVRVGRIRPNNTIWTGMFGMTYERVEE